MPPVPPLLRPRAVRAWRVLTSAAHAQQARTTLPVQVSAFTFTRKTVCLSFKLIKCLRWTKLRRTCCLVYECVVATELLRDSVYTPQAVTVSTPPLPPVI